MSSTNGHTANGKPLSLTEVKEQRKALRARIALAREKRLLESLALWDDYSSFGGQDLWDRIRPHSQAERGYTVPPSYPSDRRHGADWPIYRNQFELDRYHQESRVRVASNSFARGLLRHLTNNVIGKGYSYKVQGLGHDGKALATDLLQAEADTDPTLADLHKIVMATQKMVDEFLRENRWNGTVDPQDRGALAGTREREIFRTVQVDGECFLRFHRYAGGKTKVRFIDVSQVRDGGGHLVQDGWFLGIQHQMHPFEDIETILAYSVYWPDPAAKGGVEGAQDLSDKGTYDHVDARDVLHLKGPDTPSNVNHGLPLFIFDVGSALDRAARLQRNTSAAAAVRAAIAETWQYDTATQAQIQSMTDALKEHDIQNVETGKTEPIERVWPGMIRRGPKGAELAQPSQDNTPNFLQGVQGDLQEACAATGVPSFAIGDVSSGNYSNYESASFPPVQNATCEQEYYKAAFCRAVWKAIEWAAEEGRLPRDVCERVTLTVDAPAVLHRNELEKAQEDTALIQAGIKDRQTAAAERGLDWKVVEANNAEFAKKQAEQQQPPLGGAPPGAPPPPAPEEGGGGGNLIPFQRGNRTFWRRRARSG